MFADADVEPIHVLVRVRPLSVSESAAASETAITFDDDGRHLTVRRVVDWCARRRPRSRARMGQRSFCLRCIFGAWQIFDDARHAGRCFQGSRVFGPQHDQATVFSESGVQLLIERAVDGSAATVFAYGQTGSGKTYTMFGSSEAFNAGAFAAACVALAGMV
jgi:hypothetical protein